MAGRKRFLVLGAGLMGAGWVRRFLPTFAGRAELAALVDANRSALDDNLRTAAAVFGAIEASRHEQPVDVEAMVEELTGVNRPG